MKKFKVIENSKIFGMNNGIQVNSVISIGEYEYDIEEVTIKDYDYYKIIINSDVYFFITKSKINFI